MTSFKENWPAFIPMIAAAFLLLIAYDQGSLFNTLQYQQFSTAILIQLGLLFLTFITLFFELLMAITFAMSKRWNLFVHTAGIMFITIVMTVAAIR